MVGLERGKGSCSDSHFALWMGAFEGVRAYETDHGPAIFKLKEHTERLFNSTRILGMKIPL